MLKVIAPLLFTFACVGCTSSTNNIQQDLAFQEHKMSPLYCFQNLDEMENVALEVEGDIPEWLRGEYIRNGPGIIEEPNGSVKSWFDGLAKLHAFTIDPDQVSYTSKFLKSEAYNTFQRTGALDFAGFAQQPTEDNFSIIDFIA